MKNEGEKGKRRKGEKGKPQNRPAISVRAVRAALKELGEVNWSGVQEFFQVQTFEERQKVRQILIDLVKGGQVECTDQGIYHLTDKPGVRGAVQARLWRFACHRLATARPFTAAEAAGLAKADLDYTKRYCRWLWGACYLAIAARGRAGALLYQVVGGKEHESAPAWNRRAEKRIQKEREKFNHRGPESINCHCALPASGQEECPDWDSKAGCMGIPQTCSGACPMEHEEPQAGTPAPLEACATAPPASVGEVKKLPIEPCTLFGIRNRCAHYPDCMRSNPDLPPPEEHRPEACATNTIMRTALESAGVTGSREQLDAALEDFGRTLVKIAGGVGRAWEIIREMKGELLAVGGQGDDESGEPADGHH